MMGRRFKGCEQCLGRRRETASNYVGPGDADPHNLHACSMEATGWQKHTVRGFVSILGEKGGEKIESSKNVAGERTYKIAK